MVTPWWSLLCLALLATPGLASLSVQNFQQAQLATATWDAAIMRKVPGTTQVTCAIHCSNQDVNNRPCNCFTFDKTLGVCTLAGIRLVKEDYVKAGGRPVLVKMENDNSFPMYYSEPAVLVIGGIDAEKSVETWTLGGELNCNLPSLPRDMKELTADMLEGIVTACDKFGCLKLDGSGWVEGPSTVETRQQHTSAVVPQVGLFLAGGSASPGTMEIVSHSGVSTATIPISPERRGHCSIQIGPGTMVLAGGDPDDQADKSVKEYTWQASGGTDRELPDLNQGRKGPACGMYTVGDKKVRPVQLLPL
jgi:hypothetical protein